MNTFFLSPPSTPPTASDVPSSCEELLSVDRTLPSATYWLRIEGVRVRIFCHFGLDGEAAMYIPLVVNNETNYAHFYKIHLPDTCDDAILDTLEEYNRWDKAGYTVYNRVRLKLNNDVSSLIARALGWTPLDIDDMMTSSKGNIFRVTGPLCGEFTGHRWIPLTKASDVELWCFLWSAPE